MLALLFLFYAMWTQYLDITLVWGWQRGAYIGKLTNWAFTLTLLFLLVCSLTDLGVPLNRFKLKLMYVLIAEALFVDISFHLKEIPEVLKRLRKYSWISAHKHFFNLVWILAIAAERNPEKLSTGKQLLVFGCLAPTGLHFVYYLFAWTMAQPKSGGVLLRLLGIPEPQKNKPEDELWRDEEDPSTR